MVETPADLAMVEQTLSFSGLYFVLMGRLSPLDGVGPRDIGMDRLIARATDGQVQEVILATNFTNEGEATAHYIAEMLRPHGYNTFTVGKWHLMPLRDATVAGPFDAWPLQRGFDRWFGYQAGYTDQWHPELCEGNQPIDTPVRKPTTAPIA